MKTNGQEINVDALKVIVGSMTYEYESIIILTMWGKTYLEGYIGGDLKDRFLIEE